MASPTILDYALMSADSYHPDLPDTVGDRKYRQTLSFKRWLRTTISNEPAYGSDLYARLYLHQMTNNPPDVAVIAYRGTLWDRLGNLESDFEIAVEDQIPGRWAKAISFYHLVKLYLKGNYPDSHIPIRLTGHSLVGAYAQLVAVSTGNKAVTFNAPGIGQVHHIGANGKNYDHQILNINSKEGVINKVGKTIGQVRWLNVPEGEQDLLAAREFPELDGVATEAIGIYQQHRIKDIILTLRQNHKLASMRF